jgi:hypothetical protein
MDQRGTGAVGGKAEFEPGVPGARRTCGHGGRMGGDRTGSQHGREFTGVQALAGQASALAHERRSVDHEWILFDHEQRRRVIEWISFGSEQQSGVSVILCSRRISIDPGHGRDQSTVLIL